MLDRSILKDAFKTKIDCLTPQDLEKLAEDSSPNDAHLAQCPRCQTELALLKSFQSSEPLPAEGAAVAWISRHLERRLNQIKGAGVSREVNASERARSWFSRFFAGRRAGWLIPAAAALVILVTTAGLIHRPKEPQLRADAGTPPVHYRSQEIEVTGPAGELTDAPQTLQWKAFPGAVRYKVSIMEVDEVPLWSGETSDLVLTIPASIRAKFLPRKPVLWRVTARDRQGRVLAASQVQRFSVQRKSSRSISEVLPR